MLRNSTIAWTVAAVVVVSVPLVPDKDKYTIQISEPASKQKSKRQFDTINATCKLQDYYTTNQGLKVCEYKCNTPSKQSVYKTSRPEIICQDTINEKVMQQRRD